MFEIALHDTVTQVCLTRIGSPAVCRAVSHSDCRRAFLRVSAVRIEPVFELFRPSRLDTQRKALQRSETNCCRYAKAHEYFHRPSENSCLLCFPEASPIEDKRRAKCRKRRASVLVISIIEMFLPTHCLEQPPKVKKYLVCHFSRSWSPPLPLSSHRSGSKSAASAPQMPVSRCQKKGATPTKVPAT